MRDADMTDSLYYLKLDLAGRYAIERERQ